MTMLPLGGEDSHQSPASAPSYFLRLLVSWNSEQPQGLSVTSSWCSSGCSWIQKLQARFHFILKSPEAITLPHHCAIPCDPVTKWVTPRVEGPLFSGCQMFNPRMSRSDSSPSVCRTSPHQPQWLSSQAWMCLSYQWRQSRCQFNVQLRSLCLLLVPSNSPWLPDGGNCSWSRLLSYKIWFGAQYIEVNVHQGSGWGWGNKPQKRAEATGPTQAELWRR